MTKTDEIINCNSKEDLLNKIIVTTTPSFAQSIVPAVVGETNLFCVNCCIIKPQTAKLEPAIKILTVLGMRLDNKMLSCESSKEPSSKSDRLLTPINIETRERKTAAAPSTGTVSTFFIGIPLEK